MNYFSLKDLLKNVVDNRGKTCPVSETGLPLIATNCVKNSNLFPSFDKVRYVNDETYLNWFRGHPEPEDLIFVLKGSPGQVCLAPNPVNFCIAQDMVALRANEQLIYPPYLFAALRSKYMQNAIVNMHVGTMIPHFKKGDFDKLEVPVPNEEVQKFIGDSYLDFSKKIDLNRQMNETLEAMAQAIFKDWFVGFGPTLRKSQGETDPIKILGGLIPESTRAASIAQLFPDSFSDEGLPQGWENGSLSDYAKLNSNSWKKSNHPETVKYLDLKNTKWGIIEEFTEYQWANAPSRARRIVMPNDTLVGTVRPGNGSYTFVSEEGYTASTGFAVLTPKKSIFTNFVYIAATRKDSIDDLAHKADGGAYPAVRPDVVTGIEVVKVKELLMEAFESITSPMRKKIEHAKSENQTLAETRDYLLLKLMSGEVRVGKAA